MSYSSSNSLLKIIFAMLLFFFLGELGFIVINTTLKNNILKKPVDVHNPKPSTGLFGNNTKLSAINVNNKSLNSDSLLTSKIVNKNFIITEYRGEIIGFEKSGIKTQQEGNSAVFFLNLQVTINGNSERFNLILDKEKLKVTEVFDSRGKIVSLKDLMVGERIIISETYNKIKNDYSNYKITIVDSNIK